jgi:hypothetical protein
MTDIFVRRALKAIAADLPEEEKARLRAEARDRRLTLQETLSLVVERAEGARGGPGVPSPALVRETALQAAHDATARYLGEAP